VSALSQTFRSVLQTVLRMVPWPTEPGLRAVGQPDEWSPVIVTGNYDLTVRRVLRALEGVDAWVVIAPSGGINVWCAAAGGHLTTHQIVTALKTSGVDTRVRHRRAVLPQLAATGVMAREVSRRCGWRVRFGPVYAEDLPRYLAQDATKSDDMRHVRFTAFERVEMAAAWGVPAALLFGAAAAWLRPAWALPLALQATTLALAVFFLYGRLPGPRRAVLTAAALLVSVGVVSVFGGGAAALATAALSSVVLTAILTYDYAGSTPLEGGSFFEGQDWHITLDRERCQGVYNCWEVCPEACFEKPSPEQEKLERKIEVAHDERCIRCGACIVQCPLDALRFEDAELNLLGKRTVDASDPEADPRFGSAS
jgi:ferredoxin